MRKGKKSFMWQMENGFSNSVNEGWSHRGVMQSCAFSGKPHLSGCQNVHPLAVLQTWIQKKQFYNWLISPNRVRCLVYAALFSCRPGPVSLLGACQNQDITRFKSLKPLNLRLPPEMCIKELMSRHAEMQQEECIVMQLMYDVWGGCVVAALTESCGV